MTCHLALRTTETFMGAPTETHISINLADCTATAWNVYVDMPWQSPTIPVHFVPEPAAGVLMLAGLLGLWWLGRRRSQ